MRMDEYLEKALKEAVIDDIGDEVKGLKGWLDDLDTQYSSGNFKGAKGTVSNIIKRLNMIKKPF